MESCLVKPSRQLMVKGKQARVTRSFVASQGRKISRRSGVEKKRGIPLLEISSNENEAQNFQEQVKIEKDMKSTKQVDPIKEALKKWQKDKRLREIQEKKKKKAPFCTPHVSHQISEYSHSFQNVGRIEMNTSKMSTSITNDSKVNTSKKKRNVSKPVQVLPEKNTKPSCRTMKTRSMAKSTSNSSSTPVNNSTITTLFNDGSVSMKTDSFFMPQTLSRMKDLPGCVTRSSRNETEAPQSQSNTQPDIPNDFSFNVPAGVTSFSFCADNFKFTPLSPKSAKKFFPTRSPIMELADPPIMELPDETEQTCITENENCSEKSGDNRQNEAHLDFTEVSKDVTTKEMKENNTPVLDSRYFRNLANSEIDRLKSRCLHWESENHEQEQMIPEEVMGMIRTVIGQVQLLVTKKFKQFSGLLELNEDPTAEKKALVSDLQGFWDMMYIQVENIDKKFAELEEMKGNNWQKKMEVEVKMKNVKRTKAKKTSKKANRKVSESRNKFREMRAKMKSKLQLAGETEEEGNAFKIILTPMKNKKADADPNEPEIILTPVRRSTRKSRGCANLAIPLVNLPNVSVDLFGACKTPEAFQSNAECLSKLEDSLLRPQYPATTPVSTAAADLMIFSPTTPANKA